MRQLKHHEQKLLKKVDFLNVCLPLPSQDSSSKYSVEAGCLAAGKHCHAQVPHTGPGRLPQVGLFHCLVAAADVSKIQQAVRESALADPPSVLAAGPGSLPPAERDRDAEQAVRHGCPWSVPPVPYACVPDSCRRRLQAVGYREQSHRLVYRPSAFGRSGLPSTYGRDRL